MKTNLVATLAILLVAATGCNKSRTVETGDGTVQVTESSGTTQIEMESKEGKARLTASETAVAIPDTFPKDVPILKGAVARMTMSQGKTEILHLAIPQSVAEVTKDYQEKLKAEGWTIESTMNTGDGAMLHAKKDDRVCVLIIGKDEDSGGSGVQLSVTGK